MSSLTSVTSMADCWPWFIVAGIPLSGLGHESGSLLPGIDLIVVLKLLWEPRGSPDSSVMVKLNIEMGHIRQLTK